MKPADLEAVKDRLTRKFRGEWMDAIYPGLGFHEQTQAFGRDLIALGEAVLWPHGRCESCDWPNNPDGYCSRRGCCDSD